MIIVDRPNSSIVTDRAFLVLDQGITRTVESFFAALKTALLLSARPYPARQEVRTRSLYVEGFPDRARHHSTLGYSPPGSSKSGPPSQLQCPLDREKSVAHKHSMTCDDWTVSYTAIPK